MSFASEVMSRLNELYNRVFLTQSEPASLIVPVMAQTVPNGNNDETIYMDHDALPPMETFTYNGQDYNGHNLHGEFVYECAAQTNSGNFHLIGDSGTFSVGPVDWITNEAGPNPFAIFSYIVTRTIDGAPAYTTGTFALGNAKVDIFLKTGDMFKVLYSASFNNTGSLQIFPQTDFTITRLSRNRYYKMRQPA